MLLRSVAVYLSMDSDSPVKRPQPNYAVHNRQGVQFFAVRRCLSMVGKPFMDLKTPMEVLTVIYDLLESESAYFMQYRFSDSFFLYQRHGACIGNGRSYTVTLAPVISCISTLLLPPQMVIIMKVASALSAIYWIPSKPPMIYYT